jgi:hypothetical protein
VIDAAKKRTDRWGRSVSGEERSEGIGSGFSKWAVGRNEVWTESVPGGLFLFS